MVEEPFATPGVDESVPSPARIYDYMLGGTYNFPADRDAADAPGDMYDSAEPLTTEGTDDAIRTGLEERLAAVERAEQRLSAGTYGVSVRSGQPIPDDRLEADPAAELTVEEAD